MGMKSEHTTYRTQLGVEELRSALREALSGREEVSPLETSPLDNHIDFGVLVSKRGFFANAAFQFVVGDRGSHREVEFIALGDGAFASAARAATTNGFNKGNVKLGKSRELVEATVAEIRRRDASFVPA